MAAAFRTIGWGVFCACSWTWCIGMFLPVILIARYGWAGFFAFALPNVLGCAVFGYVVRDRDRSQALMVRHRAAMRWFSVITLAYHVFFLGFIAWALAGAESASAAWMAIAVPLAVFVASFLLSMMPARAWLPFAFVVYAVSLVAFSQLGVRPLGEIALFAGAMLEPRGGLIWLVPAIAVGFLLCPYLDLTFHRALRESPSKHAFAIFGMTFAVMIVLTAAYWDVVETGLSGIVLAHVVAQSVFTMAAHQRELRADAAAGASLVLPILALPLVLVAWIMPDPVEKSIDMYIRFLLFYGLVFPAYAVLFASPRIALQPSRGNAWKLWLAVLLGAPLYEASFVHGWTWLAILPPAAMALWLVARRNAPAAPSQASGLQRS